MAIKERKNIKPIETNESFEKTNELKRLKILITIVPQGQGDAIVKILEKHEVSASFITLGKGTADKELYELLGLESRNKHLVFSVIKEEKLDDIKEALNHRFAVSNAARGVAFTVKITSVVGVLIYKFLANVRE